MALSARRAFGNFKPVLKGALTWIPGVQRAFYDRTAAGGTAEARYCYGVWIKHLSLLWQAGMRSIPAAVSGLGPGQISRAGVPAPPPRAGRLNALDLVRAPSV